LESCNNCGFEVGSCIITYLIRNLEILSKTKFLLHLLEEYFNTKVDVETLVHFEFTCVDYVDKEYIIVGCVDKYTDYYISDIGIYYAFPYRAVKKNGTITISIREYDDLLL